MSRDGAPLRTLSAVISILVLLLILILPLTATTWDRQGDQAGHGHEGKDGDTLASKSRKRQSIALVLTWVLGVRAHTEEPRDLRPAVTRATKRPRCTLKQHARGRFACIYRMPHAPYWNGPRSSKNRRAP